MNEFEIIAKYFRKQSVHRADVILGSGDDCALLKQNPNYVLAVSIDTLLSGVHFPIATPAYDVGYKALAVNLSDLAAMGATPSWFTCALTLSEVNEAWIAGFAAGLFEVAKKYNIELVGGDLTKGPVLSITINVHGFVPEGLALRRDKAVVGDAIYVSGKLGAASFLHYQHRPEPRIDLGIALLGKAHSAIDISDGLVADLQHILEASRVGANIYVDKIPMLPEIKNDHMLALAGGDDYELCFTAPPNLELPGFEIACIGEIVAQSGLKVLQKDGSILELAQKGYKHF